MLTTYKKFTVTPSNLSAVMACVTIPQRKVLRFKLPVKSAKTEVLNDLICAVCWDVVYPASCCSECCQLICQPCQGMLCSNPECNKPYKSTNKIPPLSLRELEKLVFDCPECKGSYKYTETVTHQTECGRPKYTCLLGCGFKFTFRNENAWINHLKSDFQH